MVFVAVGAAVVGSVAGSAISAHATSKASKAATDAADKNNALQTDIYNQNKAALQPYQMAGGPATSSIQALLGLSGDPTAANAAFKQYENSTGYQTRLEQGQKSVTAALGNRGYLDSGAAQKSLLKYGQGAASAEFGNYMGYLGQQQQVGLSAASAQAGVGQGYANAVSNNNTNAANQVGNAALTNANTINGGISGIVSALGMAGGMNSSYGGGNKTYGSGGNYGGMNWGQMNG